MKMFIFKRLEQVSDRYHPGGGLAIIANDRKHAMEVIENFWEIDITDEEWESVEVYELAEKVEPKFIVFEDAGCC